VSHSSSPALKASRRQPEVSTLRKLDNAFYAPLEQEWLSQTY
jgi:hypothetical protein